MILSDVSIKRPVFATMMMVALVVLGLISYRRLAIDEYPDVTYPVVIAQTTYQGASPEVIEREVSRPIEEALNTVQGIREVASSSFEGGSIVRVLLELGTDPMAAQQDVSAKVARIRRSLPEEIDDPVIIRFDPNDRPIMSIAMQSAERPIRELTDLADEVVATRFEAIPGVGGVNVVGGAERQIKVQLDPAAMRAYAVSPPQVIAALQRENQEVPAGRVKNGANERLVRVTGRIRDPRNFADISVGERRPSAAGGAGSAAGAPIRLGDVATVVDGTAEQRSATLIGRGDRPDVRAVSVEVLKVSGTNTVEVADRVRAEMAALQGTLPPDVTLTLVRDDSERIRESLESVQHELILGAILCVVIIYFFLNSWRSTVITGLALPISIISAFFAMWVFGFTLNTMTLLALSLAIGLLIDDAIVVRENIVRHLEMGKDHDQAAKEGTDEIGLAVFATTLAVVAVFVPVAFMGGQIGKIFFQFGVTVAFAVLVSLFVSFTLDPMLSSIWADPEVEGHRHEHEPGAKPFKRNAIQRVAQRFNDAFERVADRYPGALAWALDRRWLVTGVSLVAVAVTMVLLPRLGFTYIPEFDGGEFNVGVRTTPGSSLAYTLDRGRAVAAVLRRMPEVEFTYLSIGGGFRGTPNTGSVYVRLTPKDARARSQQDVQSELRRQLARVPGVRASIMGTPSIFGGQREPIQIYVQGPEPSRLKLVAAQVLEAVRRVPGAAEPRSSEEGDIPQLNVDVDRDRAWAAGLGIGSIGPTIQPLFTGLRATEWEDAQGYSHDVVVIYPDSLRASAADVAGIVVPSTRVDARTGQPAMVPLAEVAEVRAGVGPQQIERSSLERQVTLSSNVLPGYAMGDVAARVQLAIDSVGLPPGYRTVFRGDVQNLQETRGYVLEALLLAVVFIYLILASLFGSFVQPLAIMLALPLSFIGVGGALWATGGNLNVYTMIGIIMLMGLVTKNGILLVDFANQERASGLDRRAALLSAARTRLRPIIMTTAAMIFGMVPLALALGAGAEQRAPMGRAVIGGLVTSTVLTLFVVPVAYTLLDDFARWVAARFAGAEHAAGPHAARPHGAPPNAEPVAGD